MTISAPSFEAFVEIASDGTYRTQSGITAPDSAWGGHQSRITRHNNNVLRASYVTHDSGTGFDYWRLMKSIDNGLTWNEEAKVQTVDDHALLRDVQDDSAYIVGYNSSYQMCIWSSRSNFASPQVVPGDWQVLATNQRHYSAFGISPIDGTIHLHENNTEDVSYDVAYTDDCLHDNMTARWVTGIDRWSDNTLYPGTWSFSNDSAIRRFRAGLRANYCYLFPKPLDSLTSRTFGLGTGNLAKAIAGYLDSGIDEYVFPFHQMWNLDISSLEDRVSIDVGIHDPDSATATDTPYFKPEDAYIDTKGRLFTVNFVLNDGTATMANGYWMTIYDTSSYKILNHFKISVLPTYGNVRIIEDSNQNLYLIWINAGASEPQLKLYKINEKKISSKEYLPSVFTFSPGYDLSSTLGTLAPETRSIRIACPRGGTALQDNFVDMIMQFTDNPYSGSAYPSPAYGSGGMKTYYARLKLI